jgi:hypothetical protein
MHSNASGNDIQQVPGSFPVSPEYHPRITEQLEAASAGYDKAGISVRPGCDYLRDGNFLARAERPLLFIAYAGDPAARRCDTRLVRLSRIGFSDWFILTLRKTSRCYDEDE